MSLETGSRPPSGKETKSSSPEKGFSKLKERLTERSKKLGRKLADKLRNGFKGRDKADAGLRSLAGADSPPPPYNKENPLTQNEDEKGQNKKGGKEFKGLLRQWAEEQKGWEKAKKSTEKFREKFKEGSKAVRKNMGEIGGKIKSDIKEGYKQGQERAKNRVERRNKRKTLEGVNAGKLEKGKHEGRDSWKNATESTGRWLGRVRLTPEARAFAKSHPKEMQEKLNALNPDGKKLPLRQRRKNYADSINQVSRGVYRESASQMINNIKQNPEYQGKLQDRVNSATADRSGLEPRPRQRRRIERELLREEVNNKLESQRNKTNNQEAIKKPKSSPESQPQQVKPDTQPGTTEQAKSQPEDKNNTNEKNKEAELTPEQKARKEILELGLKLGELGINSKSPGGQELIDELAKNPDQMANFGSIADKLIKAKAGGPEAANQTAKEQEDSLQKQIDEEKDEEKKGILKSLLNILKQTLKIAGIATVGAVGVTAVGAAGAMGAVGGNNK
jgi:hypothetical protein